MELSIKQNIQVATQKFIDTNGISQVDLATKAGVSKEHLGNILKGVFTYSSGKNKTGDIPVKHFYNLAGFIGLALKKEFWQIKPTPQFTTGISVLKEAREFGETRVLVGNTGTGKTTLIDQFTKKFPADVFSIKVGSSDNLGDVIDKICDALNIPIAKTKGKKLRDIAKRLQTMRSEGYKPCLIIDECEYAKAPLLCAFKELYDYLQGICALCFAGTDQFLFNIEKLRKRNKAGIPQLWRRLKFTVRELPAINKRENYKFFIDGIKDLNLKKFLLKHCDNYGELHDVLMPCYREADRLNTTLTLDFVKTVLNLPDTLQ